jgi:hypothetical protein
VASGVALISKMVKRGAIGGGKLSENHSLVDVEN